MLRTNRLVLTMAVAVTAALAVGCGSSGGGKASEPAATTTTTTKPSGPAAVKIGTTKLGPILVDKAGHTLYVYDADPDSQTVCIDDLCRFSWPALVVPTKSVPVGPGLKPSLFKTIPGHKGVLVVAVNGRPLYRSVNDKKPGDTTGNAAGGIWHAVNPDGEALG